MTDTRILARSAALLVVCIVAACQSSSPLDLGPAVTDETAWSGSVLTWSRSDSEIVFSVAPWKARALKAFRVSDGAERTIDMGKAYQAASPAPAGDELYYVADVSPSIGARDMRLYEATSGRELASMRDLTAFAVNPDGQRIAFARGRANAGFPVRSSSQTFILNVADGRLSELVPCRIPLRFSPDGSQLLCQTGKYEYRVEPAIVDLASGTTAALPERFGNLIGVDPAVFGVDLIWKSSGLRAVYCSDTSGVDVVVENAATGERTLLRADSVPGAS
jgi:hypothetical protein